MNMRLNHGGLLSVRPIFPLAHSSVTLQYLVSKPDLVCIVHFVYELSASFGLKIQGNS